MADPLLSLSELRTWTREAIDSPEDIDFAEAVIDAVSLRVAEEVGYAAWLADPSHTSTLGARAVALQVARRTYLNPDQETRTASIGPIGGSSYLDDFARGLELTESETERLAALKEAGSDSPAGGLSVLRIERADPIGPGYGDIILQDSDAPESAGIAYAHESDAAWFGAQQ